MLPALLADDIATDHLKSSGKQVHPKKCRKASHYDDDDSNLNITSYSNIDYSTFQRGHQYSMESYIPGRYVQFCCNQGQVWVQARCYCSQVKAVSVDLTCTQMQQTWHKPRPSQIEAEPLMNIAFAEPSKPR